MKADKLILATQALVWVAEGLDMTKQASWDALMAVANELAKTAPEMVADVMAEIERRYK
jgi:hypothetical protein